jgi:hypothetical protein
MPRDAQVFQQLLQEVMLENKPDLQYRPEFWSLFSARQSLALNASKPLSELRTMRPDSVATIDKLVEKHKTNINKLSFVPALFQQGEFAAILDSESGEFLTLTAIDPWIQ